MHGRALAWLEFDALVGLQRLTRARGARVHVVEVDLDDLDPRPRSRVGDIHADAHRLPPVQLRGFDA